MQPFLHQASAIFGKDQRFIVAPSQAGPWPEGRADPTSHNFTSAIEPLIPPRGQWNGLRPPCQGNRAKTENEIPQHIPGHPAALQLIRPVTDQDWKNHRARITEIYWEQDKDLDAVIEIMKSEHRFLATERQYKRKFKDWDLRKNTSTDESWAMIRIRKRRKEQEGKLTIFKLREREVPSENINRFAKRRKLGDGEALPILAPTPPDLTYHTPPSAPSPEAVDAPVVFTSTSLAPAVRTPAASLGRNMASPDIQFSGSLPYNVRRPTMEVPTGVFTSPPHLTQSSARVFERAEDISHVDQSLTARGVTDRPFDIQASEYLQFLNQPLRIQEYVDIELSDQLHHSHLSDPLTVIPYHGSGRSSVLAVTPERSLGSDEYADPSPTTLVGMLNHASSASLTTDITDQQPSNTVTQPSNLTSKSRPTSKDASVADTEVIYLAAIPKADHHESEIGLGTKERTTTTPGIRPELIENGPSHDGMVVGGFITTASPAPSSTDYDVYATPMSVAVDSHATGSDSDSDDYATPMGFTVDPSNTPRADAENRGTPMDHTIVKTFVISEQEAYPDDNATPKNTTVDYLSPTPESEYATPMEIAITGSIVVSEKLFDDEIHTVEFSVYERSVKLTARAQILGEPIEAIEKRLRFAAKVGDLKAVEELLRRGATISARSKTGMSALHLATYYGHSEVLKFLLDIGAMLDTVSSKMEFRLAGRNLSISNPHPIHLAALRGHQECTDIVLERTNLWTVPDLEEIADMDDYSDDLLKTAIENDHVQLAKLIIRSRGKNWFERYEWSDDEDETPLAIVARNGSLALLSLFLDNGMSPNTRCGRGATLLWIASARGHEPIVDFLLQHHAIVDLHDRNGVAPLDVAIAEGHEIVAKKLLERSASASDGRETCFGLYLAVEKGDINMVRLLLAHGWNPNVRYRGDPLMNLHNGYTDSFCDLVKSMHDKFDLIKDRWTPLHVAVDNGCEDMVTILLQNGASLAFDREDGLISPVRLAGKRGHAGVLQILRNHVADVAWTPLGLATFNGCVATTLRKSSNPNLYANGRQPPLHIAVDQGLPETAELLLGRGADVNALDSLGQSPLHNAVALGDAEMVEVLLEGGADVNLCAGNGLSALHIALTKAHKSWVWGEILGKLLDRGADAALISPLGGASNDMTVIVNHVITKYSWSMRDWHLMHLASGVGDESTLRSLLQLAKKGQHLVRIKSLTKRNETALHVAARAGHLEAVRLFANADRPATRIVDSNMDTPLHVAVKSSRLDIARELFQLGGVAYQLTYKMHGI
ncbi:ankyrin [Colletotrichum eremochloae]|nr:ankyrin [Colletotrichum eremochloae]